MLETNKFGRVVPYQDPARGRLPGVTLDAAGGLLNSIKENVLVNLSGPDSIIGRSIGVYMTPAVGGGGGKGGDAPPAPVAGTPTLTDCCVIGFAETDLATVTPHHHHYAGAGRTPTSRTGGYTPYAYGPLPARPGPPTEAIPTGTPAAPLTTGPALETASDSPL